MKQSSVSWRSKSALLRKRKRGKRRSARSRLQMTSISGCKKKRARPLRKRVCSVFWCLLSFAEYAKYQRSGLAGSLFLGSGRHTQWPKLCENMELCYKCGASTNLVLQNHVLKKNVRKRNNDLQRRRGLLKRSELQKKSELRRRRGLQKRSTRKRRGLRKRSAKKRQELRRRSVSRKRSALQRKNALQKRSALQTRNAKRKRPESQRRSV